MGTQSAALSGSLASSIQTAKARFGHVDPVRLQRFLEAQTSVQGDVVLGEISYPSSGAGASNGIGFFTAQMDTGAGVESRDLVVRYSPGVQLLKQKRFSDEFLTVRSAHAAGLPVPNVLWLDAEGATIGFPAFVMEHVHGDAPAAAMYSSGPLALMTPERRKATMLEAAGFHGALRKAAIGPDRVPHLVERGVGNTAIERELSWWMQELNLLPDPDPAKIDVLKSVFRWLVDNQPRAVYSAGLVHGDAQIANIIFNEGKIAAVIDWELSYLGHNESDLALVIAVTETQKILDKPVEGTPTESEYISRYEAESGGLVQYWEYFSLFNAFKCLAIMPMVASFMPSFDQVWAFYRDLCDTAWTRARSAGPAS